MDDRLLLTRKELASLVDVKSGVEEKDVSAAIKYANDMVDPDGEVVDRKIVLALAAEKLMNARLQNQAEWRTARIKALEDQRGREQKYLDKYYKEVREEARERVLDEVSDLKRSRHEWKVELAEARRDLRSRMSDNCDKCGGTKRVACPDFEPWPEGVCSHWRTRECTPYHEDRIIDEPCDKPCVVKCPTCADDGGGDDSPSCDGCTRCPRCNSENTRHIKGAHWHCDTCNLGWMNYCEEGTDKDGGGDVMPIQCDRGRHEGHTCQDCPGDECENLPLLKTSMQQMTKLAEGNAKAFSAAMQKVADLERALRPDGRVPGECAERRERILMDIGQRYRLREGLEIEYREGAPKSRGKLRFYDPDVKSPKSRDGAVYLDMEEVEVLFEPVPFKRAADVTPEDGIKNEPRDIKGYAICPEWWNSVPFCSWRACPAYEQMDDIRTCKLQPLHAIYHTGDRAVCEPEVQRWTRERSCPVPDEDAPEREGDVDPYKCRGWFPHVNCSVAMPEFNGDDEPDTDASFDWESLERWVKTHDGRLSPVGILILSKAALELRKSLDGLREACRNDASGDLAARIEIRERLDTLEEQTIRKGDTLTLVTPSGMECEMTVR